MANIKFTILAIKPGQKWVCGSCGNNIESQHKVVSNGGSFHLSCFRLWLIERLKEGALTMRRYRDNLSEVNKYKSEMICETLEKIE